MTKHQIVLRFHIGFNICLAQLASQLKARPCLDEPALHMPLRRQVCLQLERKAVSAKQARRQAIAEVKALAPEAEFT